MKEDFMQLYLAKVCNLKKRQDMLLLPELAFRSLMVVL